MNLTNKDLETAITLATRYHSGQVDKAGKSYILHPLRVMLMGKTIEEQIVGVCHDLFEDTSITYRALEHQFNKTVADAVAAMSRDYGEQAYEETYMDFIERVAKNELARKVKLYDLADNMDYDRLSELPEVDRKKLLSRYSKAKAYLQRVEFEEYFK